jgi:hypothetical protein
MAKEVKNVLKPYGELDVLPYYSKVSKFLEKFLKGREIATKTVLPNFTFLKRGSKDKPLFINDLRFIDEKMLKLRTKHLDEVKDKLKDKQILIWQYFVPRKPVNFFYATNGENPGKEMDRVFIDIDRQTHTPEDARRVALELVKVIKQDKEFSKLVKFKIFLMWTGSSFHVCLLLEKKVSNDFYQKYLSYGEKKESSFITKWAEIVSANTRITVRAGHQREKDAIILDSSNTPSGKLARVPFSLHISSKGEIDGVAVPLSEKELEDINLIKRLEKLKPEDVLENLDKYKKLL